MPQETSAPQKTSLVKPKRQEKSRRPAREQDSHVGPIQPEKTAPLPPDFTPPAIVSPFNPEPTIDMAPYFVDSPAPGAVAEPGPPSVNKQPSSAAPHLSMLGVEVAPPEKLGPMTLNICTWKEPVPKVELNHVAAMAPEPAGSTPSPLVKASVPRSTETALQLLWIDLTYTRRIRRQPAWKQLLSELPASERSGDVGVGSPDGDPAEVEDSRDVFEILVAAEPVAAIDLSHPMKGATSWNGKFVPWLALVAGELEFMLDPLKLLSETANKVTPFCDDDANLKVTVQAVKKALAESLVESSQEAVERYLSSIRTAYRAGKHKVAFEKLQKQVEQRLLENRNYHRKTAFDGTQLRGIMRLPGAVQPIPTYLPDYLATKIPALNRIDVRLIAEVHARQDQNESHPTALRVIALGRALLESKD